MRAIHASVKASMVVIIETTNGFSRRRQSWRAAVATTAAAGCRLVVATVPMDKPTDRITDRPTVDSDETSTSKWSTRALNHVNRSVRCPRPSAKRTVGGSQACVRADAVRFGRSDIQSADVELVGRTRPSSAHCIGRRIPVSDAAVESARRSE